MSDYLQLSAPLSLFRDIMDDDPSGWIAHSGTVKQYQSPHQSKPTFQPWEEPSSDAVEVVRTTATKEIFWKDLCGRYSEEKQEYTIAQDNVSVIKSIFQLLDDEPWAALKPSLEKLLADKDKDKQRASAEVLAGVINGKDSYYL